MLVDRILKGPSRPISPWSELEHGIGRVPAEFSFWPLGWVLTFDDATVQDALDVSDCFKIGYQEQRKFTCVVPCHWVAAPRDRDAWRPGARWAPRDRRLLRVLELRRRLQRFLRRSRQDDLALLLLEPAHRHRDLMLSDAEESADADDRV